jgi:predicted amidohydrolase YtcJ
MRPITLRRGAGLGLGLVLVVACTDKPAPRAAAMLLVMNGRIFGQSPATAVLIEDGRVAAVGPDAEMKGRVATGGQIIDARGGLILPGLHDAHIHMAGGAASLEQLALDELKTLPEVIAALKIYAEAHPGDGWILGRGWMYDIVPKGQFPTRGALDQVVKDRPVLLESYDGHSSWANSRALALAGVTAATPDPADGSFVREKDGRTPAGVLLENAAEMVWHAVPTKPRAEKVEALSRAIQHVLALGVTSVDDITADQETPELYETLLQQGRLPIRVTVSLPLEGDLGTYAKLRDRLTSPFLRFGFLKGFVDGVIESKTAYMLEPYAGATDRGKPLIEPSRMLELVRRAQTQGFRVAFHSIGDAATRQALDTFAAVQKELPRPGMHHRLEHLEVLDPADLPSFQRLGVIASIMPYHANPGGDEPNTGVWAQNLGEARLAHSFAWRELLTAGATLACGSDWPVMSADPLRGLGVATSRRDEDGRPKEGWYAGQRMTADEAVRCYTEGSAAAIGRETELGRLAPGFAGDLVVLAPGVELEKPETLWKGERIQVVVTNGVVRYAGGAARP